MNHDYFITKTLADGRPNRRFYKVLYTAALRFGVVLTLNSGGVRIEFTGQESNDVEAHTNNRALEGTLTLNGLRFPDVIVIDNPGQPGRRPSIRTFWPISQHADAHESYTDPLVDTAMDGTPYDINIVASSMHERFKENAGVSPATLMKVLYETEAEMLRAGAQRIGQLLEDAHHREKEAVDLAETALSKLSAESERANLEKSLKEKALRASEEKDAEIERLQKLAHLNPDRGTLVTPSNIAILESVSEEVRGRNGQMAILLHMSDGTVRANNWANGYQSRLALAQKLVGHKVRTEAWKNFPWEQWYQNIYRAD
jgi:hypothetical protein